MSTQPKTSQRALSSKSLAIATNEWIASRNMASTCWVCYGFENHERNSKPNTRIVSSDDQVKAYIKKIMSQLDKWMVGGKISKLVIVITDKDTGEHVERWQFDVRTIPDLPSHLLIHIPHRFKSSNPPNPSPSPPRNPPTKKTPLHPTAPPPRKRPSRRSKPRSPPSSAKSPRA